MEGGVTEGRKVFANILKYIRMGAGSNFGTMLNVLGASVFLPFIPISSSFDYTTFFIMLWVFNRWDPSRAPVFSDGLVRREIKTCLLRKKWI